MVLGGDGVGGVGFRWATFGRKSWKNERNQRECPATMSVRSPPGAGWGRVGVGWG